MEPFDQDKEEEEQEDEEEEKEGLRARVVRKGYDPTRREVEEHMVNHLPYRSWCAHCVKGSAKGLQHRAKDKEDKEEERVALVSIDYMFMHDKQGEGEERGMPILVARDRKSKITRARVVPQKGRHWYAIKVLKGIMMSLGYKRAILKSDQEPAILSLKEAVINELGIEVIEEESPEYDSRANGEIERTCQSVQNQFRVMKDGLEARYGVRLNGEHNCIPWLMAHASDTINRYQVHGDGRTAYHRWKGKQFNKECVEFGECVLYLKPGTRGKDKFDTRWEEGIWLGVKDRSLETVIGTNEGVIKVRDVKRKGTEEQRWDISKFNEFKGVPWEPIPGREGIEIKARVNVPREGGRPDPVMRGSEPVPRRARITREDMRKMGFTVGCPGCRAINRGLPAVNHSEQCRARIEKELKDKGDDRVERVGERLKRGRAEEVQDQGLSLIHI